MCSTQLTKPCCSLVDKVTNCNVFQQNNRWKSSSDSENGSQWPRQKRHLKLLDIKDKDRSFHSMQRFLDYLVTAKGVNCVRSLGWQVTKGASVGSSLFSLPLLQLCVAQQFHFCGQMKCCQHGKNTSTSQHMYRVSLLSAPDFSFHFSWRPMPLEQRSKK